MKLQQLASSPARAASSVSTSASEYSGVPGTGGAPAIAGEGYPHSVRLLGVLVDPVDCGVGRVGLCSWALETELSPPSGTRANTCYPRKLVGLLSGDFGAWLLSLEVAKSSRFRVGLHSNLSKYR